MRLARTALLLVAFSLLTSAATAYAECAWVRWFNAGERWSLMGGFPSLESCDAAITTAVSYAVVFMTAFLGCSLGLGAKKLNLWQSAVVASAAVLLVVV